MTVHLIVAMDEGRLIGRNNDLPWHLPADLRRFRALTMGHPIVMGRRTWESIGRPLPGRTSIVVTRQADFAAGGALLAAGLPEALRLAAGDDEVFVIGGAEIYHLALPLADRLYVTAVHAHVEGDRWFPEIPSHQWRLVEETFHQADAKNVYDYSFQVLDRHAGDASAG